MDIWAENEKDCAGSDSSDDAWGEFGGGNKDIDTRNDGDR